MKLIINGTFFKMVLGNFPRGKLPPILKLTLTLTLTLTPTGGAIFLKGNCPGYPLKYVSLKHSVTIAVFCP